MNVTEIDRPDQASLKGRDKYSAIYAALVCAMEAGKATHLEGSRTEMINVLATARQHFRPYRLRVRSQKTATGLTCWLEPKENSSPAAG